MATIKPVRIIGKAKLNERRKELQNHARALLNTASGILNGPATINTSKVLDLIRGAQDCLIRLDEIELVLKKAVK